MSLWGGSEAVSMGREREAKGRGKRSPLERIQIVSSISIFRALSFLIYLLSRAVPSGSPPRS
jgi:hypothetical protein